MKCHCNLLVGDFHRFGVEYFFFHGLVLENRILAGTLGISVFVYCAVLYYVYTAWH